MLKKDIDGELPKSPEKAIAKQNRTVDRFISSINKIEKTVLIYVLNKIKVKKTKYAGSDIVE
ncbi:hypothetical protein ASD40_10790 [Paenibacillus sp. Root444D2]|nr:hypothetical protein ASD40_10790 [Paenibacillus sp. Root444D2]